MNFMEYANRTHSNIIPKESFEYLIQDVFNIIATNLAKSLGPLGSNTTILDGMMTDATKDGYTIFKNYRFHNRYKRMIYNLMKAPCTALNNTVGDGTTTAIVLTNFLFEEYHGRMKYEYTEDGKLLLDGNNEPVRTLIPGKKYQLEKLYRLPRTLIKTIDDVIEDIIDKIKDYTTTIDPSDFDTIYHLAYVASNGNHEIATNMAETYKNSKVPVIKMKNSPTNKSYISPVTGFEFPSNLISDAYARNEDLSVTHKDICTIIFDFKIDTDLCNNFIIPLNAIMKGHGKKLLVLAPSYDAYLVNTFLEQHINYEYQKDHELNLILAQYPLGKLEPNQLKDLSIVLRTWILTQEMSDILVEKFKELSEGERYDLFDDIFTEDAEKAKGNDFNRMIGTAAEALLSCTNGSIFKVKDIEEDLKYRDALHAAELELKNIRSRTDFEKQSFAYEVGKVQNRISQLKMENFIYYVGADSALQHRITEDTIDDVIKCLRSAVKSGIVPGCQLSIIRACNDLADEILKDSDPKEISNDDQLQLMILMMIQNAVRSTYATILHGPEFNGMTKLIPLWDHINTDEGHVDLIKKSMEKCNEIIDQSVTNNQVFDLETLKFSDAIVTSAETDIMVLKASSELIKLLIAGNQCLYLDSEIDSSHEETREAYV